MCSKIVFDNVFKGDGGEQENHQTAIDSGIKIAEINSKVKELGKPGQRRRDRPLVRSVSQDRVIISQVDKALSEKRSKFARTRSLYQVDVGKKSASHGISCNFEKSRPKEAWTHPNDDGGCSKVQCTITKDLLESNLKIHRKDYRRKSTSDYRTNPVNNTGNLRDGPYLARPKIQLCSKKLIKEFSEKKRCVNDTGRSTDCTGSTIKPTNEDSVRQVKDFCDNDRDKVLNLEDLPILPKKVSSNVTLRKTSDSAQSQLSENPKVCVDAEPRKDVHVYTFRTRSNSVEECNIIKKSESVHSNVSKEPKLQTSQSLDIDLKPNYTGYKPEHGICFISFKNMFTKPDRFNFEKMLCSEITDTEGIPVPSSTTSKCYDNFEENKNKLMTRSHSTPSSDTNQLCLENSGSNFSDKELALIEQTRNELRQRISSARESRCNRRSSSSKIKVNIFLKSRAESSSVETNDQFDSLTNESQEYILEDIISSVDSTEEEVPIKNFDSASTVDAESFTQGQGPIANSQRNRPLEQDYCPINKIRTKSEDVLTMMSLRCPSPELKEEFCTVRATHIKETTECKHPEKQTRESAPCDGNIDSVVLASDENHKNQSAPKTLKNEGNFLKTLISESRNYRPVRQQLNVKESRIENVRIDTEYDFHDDSVIEDSCVARAPKLTRKNFHRDKAHNSAKRVVEEMQSDSPREAELPANEQKPLVINIQTRIETYSDNAMQALRKKVEESRELHRRLHFCGVKVSKETVMRALLSPTQIKMYEKLYHGS